MADKQEGRKRSTSFEGTAEVLIVDATSEALRSRGIATPPRPLRGRTIEDAIVRISEERRKWPDCLPVIVIPVPPGRGDVGDCTAAEAWAAIMQALPDRFSVGTA